MNYSPVSKIGKIVSRVTPSKISSKFKRSKEKVNERGLQLQEVSAEQPRPGTSRDTGISVIEESQPAAVFRKGRFEGESSQPSNESGTHPAADPIPSTSWARRSPPRTPQQQEDLDNDMDRMIAEIMDSDNESMEMAKQKLKKLRKSASALLQKKKSFDSENESPPSSSINAPVPRRAEPQQDPSSGFAPKESPPQHLEDPDKIIALPDRKDGESGRARGAVLVDAQTVKKKGAVHPSSSARRRHIDHVSIETGFIQDAAANGGQGNPTYLETYLGYMYNCCLSPFLPEGSTGGIWGYCVKFCLVQVIIYWAFTISAIIETLSVAKFYCFKNIAEVGLENFTNMCFYIMNACLKIYSAYLFTVQQQKFAKMLRSLARLRAFASQNSNVEAVKYSTWKVTLLAAVSMSVSILSVVFAFNLLDWTLEKGLLTFAVRMAAATFVWTPEGATEHGTQLGSLQEEFGGTMTARNAAIGCLGFGLQLITRIIANAMSDLILTTAATIGEEMGQLAKDVGNPENDIYPVTMANFEAEDGQWAHYQLLKQAVDDTNDTFDCLLKYIHVDNMMLVVYFFMNVFDGGMSAFTVVNFLYNMIKAALTYRIGTKASEKNETFQEWIRRLICKSDDKNFTRIAHVNLDRMKIHPLGLGQGQFLIDESFLFRFIGEGGSVFVLQAQSREGASG